MIWWCRRRSTSNWRTAKSCVSTPRWCRPTFIIRPTTRCCGMWYAWLRAWSAASPKRWSAGVSRGFAIARARHDGGWWQSNGEPGVQGRPALSRRHRGAHLGVVPRSRHEALSRRRSRALRTVGRGGRARQQPHEDSSAVDAPIGDQAKSRLTIPISFLFVAEETAAPYCKTAWSQPALREIASKIASKYPANAEICRQFAPGLL